MAIVKQMQEHISRAKGQADQTEHSTPIKAGLDARLEFFLSNCVGCALLGANLAQKCNADPERNVLADDIDVEGGCPDKVERLGDSNDLSAAEARIWGTRQGLQQHVDFFSAK